MEIANGNLGTISRPYRRKMERQQESIGIFSVFGIIGKIGTYVTINVKCFLKAKARVRYPSLKRKTKTKKNPKQGKHKSIRNAVFVICCGRVIVSEGRGRLQRFSKGKV